MFIVLLAILWYVFETNFIHKEHHRKDHFINRNTCTYVFEIIDVFIFLTGFENVKSETLPKKFRIMPSVDLLSLFGFRRSKGLWNSDSVHNGKNGHCCKRNAVSICLVIYRKLHLFGFFWELFWPRTMELSSICLALDTLELYIFSNFSCMFLNTNNFFQFEI